MFSFAFVKFKIKLLPMRLIIYHLLWVSLLSISCLSSVALKAQSRGIQFFHGTWSDALEAAKEKRQLIFVDAYAEWCGPCKMMNRNTFPKREVGEFFNQNFVNYKFDMEKGEGPDFADRYQVNAYPTLLFINYKGELVHKAVAYQSPRELILLGKEALDPAKNKTNLALAYEAGTNNPQKLYDYAITLLQIGEDYREVAKKYFATQSESDLISPQNWEAIRALVNELDSREFQYLLAKQKKFAKKYGKEAILEKIRAVCKLNTIAAVMTKNPKRYQAALNIALNDLNDKGETASRLRLTYAEASKNWQDYTFKALIHFKNYTITDAKELNQAAWNFYEQVDDIEQLGAAVSWARQSTAIENAYYNHRTYASLLYKSGNYQAALRVAHKTLGLAEVERKDPTEMQALIRQIRAANSH